MISTTLLCIATLFNISPQDKTLKEVDKAFKTLKLNKSSTLLIGSMIAVESRFQPEAISFANAKGLLQLTDIGVEEVRRVNPKCVRENYNIWDSFDNIKISTCFVDYLYDIYNNREEVLIHYNSGSRDIEKYRKGLNINYETSNYLNKINRIINKCK